MFYRLNSPSLPSSSETPVFKRVLAQERFFLSLPHLSTISLKWFLTLIRFVRDEGEMRERRGREEGRDGFLQLTVYKQDSTNEGRDSPKMQKTFWKAFALNAMRVCVERYQQTMRLLFASESPSLANKIASLNISYRFISQFDSDYAIIRFRLRNNSIQIISQFDSDYAIIRIKVRDHSIRIAT